MFNQKNRNLRERGKSRGKRKRVLKKKKNFFPFLPRRYTGIWLSSESRSRCDDGERKDLEKGPYLALCGDAKQQWATLQHCCCCCCASKRERERVDPNCTSADKWLRLNKSDDHCVLSFFLIWFFFLCTGFCSTQLERIKAINKRLLTSSVIEDNKNE